MNNAELNNTLIDNYFELFRRLSNQGKQELISKLKNSMRKDKSIDEKFYSSFGSYKGKESSEDLINDIKNSRTFNRNIPEL